MNVVPLDQHRLKPIVSCDTCKHLHKEPRYAVKVCQHPDARIVDRVDGVLYPRVDGWVSGKTVKAHLDRCDSNGWYQEQKSWWERIFP